MSFSPIYHVLVKKHKNSSLIKSPLVMPLWTFNSLISNGVSIDNEVEFIQDDGKLKSHVFYIKVPMFRLVFKEEADKKSYNEKVEFVGSQVFLVRQCDLLCHDRAKWKLASILSAMNVPSLERQTLVLQISSSLQRFINHEGQISDWKILPVVFLLGVAVFEPYDEIKAITDGLTESLNAMSIDCLPTAESIIKALQKVKIDDCWNTLGM